MLLDDAQSIRPQLDTETSMGPCYSTELLTICTESILNKKESKCAYMMLFIIYSFHQVQWYTIIQCISIDSKPCICVASWTNGCVPFVKETSKKTTPGCVFDQIGHVLNILIHAHDGVLEGTKMFQVKWDVKDKFGNSITNNYERNWISAMSFHKSQIYHNPSGPGIAINELDWIVYVLLCSTRNRTHHDRTVYWDPVGIIDNSQVYMELTEVN